METPEHLKFECFELDFAERELLKDGRSVKIEPQVFDLLWYFACNAGQLSAQDIARTKLDLNIEKGES